MFNPLFYLVQDALNTLNRTFLDQFVDKCQFFLANFILCCYSIKELMGFDGLILMAFDWFHYNFLSVSNLKHLPVFNVEYFE